MTQEYLSFFVKALSLMNLWPKKYNGFFTFGTYYATLIITFTTIPIVADLVAQFYENEASFVAINENLVALSALYAVTYVSICFIKRKLDIKTLVSDLKQFELFTPRTTIQETDNSVKFYTKLFIIYGIIGNICYELLPVIFYQTCENKKTPHMIKFGIPCGLVVRFLLPFKFDTPVLATLVALWECVICILGTTIVIIISMLICGVLIHVTTQLKQLQKYIFDLSEINNEEILEGKVRFCVRFHTAIIDYASRADFCFNQMMLMHITWTGFIISILGYEISTTSDFGEAIRFSMHLFGWVAMLFLVSYYGQILMDESLNVGTAAYSFSWYKKSPKIRKYFVLMLLRSQKPLTLKAFGLKVMSLTTFLGVMYSAYSYFTLLIRFK